MSDPNKAELKLYRGWKDPGRFVWSPFVTKIELRLRVAEVKYHTEVGSVREAPKGKIPYIEFAEKDKLGDSTLIIKRLVKEGYVDDLNEFLSYEQNAYDLALRALLEDKLYFYHVS
jgi:hypothetical protein